MQVTPQITFRDIEATEAIEERIHRGIEKLSTMYDAIIISCHATIEQVQKHQHQGKIYKLTLVVNVPGKELIANHHEDEDVYIAIRDAFKSMTRQLESFRSKQQGEVKVHPEVHHGHVLRLMPEEMYGFIGDGRTDNEYYFHENNLVDCNFADIKVGDKVHFIEATGDEGPQAHRVTLHEN